jgi:PAS domain S-box-containing protein
MEKYSTILIDQIRQYLGDPATLDPGLYPFLKSVDLLLQSRNLETREEIVADRSVGNQCLSDSSQNSTDQYQSFLDEQNIFICRFKADGQLLFVNECYCRYLGKSKSELIGSYFRPDIAEKDMEPILQLFQAITPQDPVFKITYQVTVAGNSLRWHQWTLKGFFNENQQLVELLGTGIDITEQKQTEQQLRENESFFRQVIDTTPTLIFVADADNIFRMVNQAMADMYGVTKEDLLNQNCATIHQQAEEAVLYNKISQQVIRQKVMLGVEETFTKANGEVRWLYTIKKPLYMPDGRVNVLGIATDITEQKNTSSRLQSNENKYRQLVECATEMIYECDQYGYFVYANPVTCRIVGYSEEVLTTKHFSEFVAPEHREMVIQFYQKQVSDRISDTYLEFKSLMGNGEWLWLGQNVHMLVEGDQFIGFQMIARDITERKKVEDELINAKKIAEASVKEKEHFLSVMSHEIRTPLNSVIGLTHILLEDNPAPNQVEQLQAIKFSADNLMVIINDILDFSKIESGKIAFENIEFELSAIFKGIEQSFGYQAEANNLRLLFHQDASIPQVMTGDPVRLNQILLNLVSNALKFTEKGFIEVKARCLKKKDGQATIEFNVTDTGIGIPANKLATIFESFTQASSETTRKYGGTGLGLAITKKIIEMQGGEIHVKSKVGLGAVFTFRLTFGIPVKQPQSTIAFKLHEHVEPVVQDLQNVRILLVEDNKMNQLVVCKFLQKWGVHIDIAENGLEAIEKLKHNAYEIILMDLQMPQMDGYKAAQYIRNNMDDLARTVPIVALTASALFDVKRKVLDAGMNDFITKPFDPRELHLKILKYTLKKAKPLEVFLAPVTQETQYVNLSYLEEISANNTEFIRDMIRLFIRQTPQFLQMLHHACHTANWEDIKYIAHKMKSTLATIGIIELESVMMQIESFATQENYLEEIIRLATYVTDVCTQVFDELNHKLTTL